MFVFASVNSAKGDELSHANRLATELLASRGPLTRRDGELYAGELRLRGDTTLVDEVRRTTGYGCTIFDRNVRVSTTAIAAGGTARAVGTTANDDITREVFRLGGRFSGIAFTIGKDWLIAYSPLRDSGGRIVGMLAVFRELLEFKADLLRVQTQTGVLRVAPSGRIMDANLAAADYALADRATVVGSSIHRWLQADWRALPSADAEFEAKWVQPDGFSFVAYLQARWLGDSHLVVMRDFTAEARARQDLAQANLALDQARREAERANEGKSMFLANVSHELRTPLTAVLGYTQLLLEEAPEHADDLRRIESSGGYLLTLIDDLLDVTKARSGHLDVSVVPTDLSTVFAQLRDVGFELAGARGNHFTCEVSALPQVRGDNKRIRQVLYNLVSNACKFTTQGQVEVTASICAVEVAIDVRDTGMGMDEEQLGELFQEFGQVHRTRRAELGGTGLGLALSRRLADAMGGRLTVSSAPFIGSTFTLHLQRTAGGLPSTAQVRSVEVRDAAGTPLARVRRSAVTAPFPLLLIGIKMWADYNVAFGWHRWTYGVNDQTDALSVERLLPNLLELTPPIPPPADSEGQLDQLRNALLMGLNDPERGRGDPAFQAFPPYVAALSGPGADDIALVSRAIRDHRLGDLYKAHELSKSFGGDLTSLRDAFVDRLATDAQGNEASWLDHHLYNLPEGTFAEFTATEASIVADPIVRTRARGLVARLADHGPSSVTPLTDILLFHANEMRAAETQRGTERDKTYRVHGAMIEGVQMGLCRLGTDAAPARETVEEVSQHLPPHFARREPWLALRVQLGTPIDQVVTPESAKNVEETKRRVQQRLDQHRGPGDCAKG